MDNFTNYDTNYGDTVYLVGEPRRLAVQNPQMQVPKSCY